MEGPGIGESRAHFPIVTLSTVVAVTLVLAPLGRSAARSAASEQAAPASQVDPSSSLRRTVAVPIDHEHPRRGTFDLYYELGRPFDPTKPTVIVVSDARQWSPQPAPTSLVQQRLFDDRLNVVAVPGRIGSQELRARVTAEGATSDWEIVYRLFSSRQWCADLEAVRCAVVGAEGRILLYGGDGGAFLVQEYLGRYGAPCDRAFLEAGGNPALDAQLGILPDTFWEELGAADPALQGKLLAALEAAPDRRIDIIAALSRQTDSHTGSALTVERARLIEIVAGGDWNAFATLCERYEVAALSVRIPSASAGARDPLDLIPVVRTYELLHPLLENLDLFGARVHPELELDYRAAEPLIELGRKRAIRPPQLDLAALRELDCEVFLLAGRWDRSADYRTQIELARVFARSTLFLADDTGEFKEPRAPELLRKLRVAFLLGGRDASETQLALGRMKRYRWQGLPEPPPMPGVSDPAESRRFTRYLRAHLDEIQAAAEPYLKADPSVGGTINLRMVWEDGRLVAAKLLVDGTGDPRIPEAVLQTLLSWQIPDLEGPCDISLPIRIRLASTW